MYHPTRGGVRGGRDQFKWDDVKVDKHRENYLGHSIMAPVGRWQKGKDLHWYTRDKKSAQDKEAAKEEIRRIKEQEEQAMREALGLAPKSSSRSHGNRLDKHEFQELVKKGSTAEDLGEGHADAVQVHGLGFARAPRAWEDPSTLPSNIKEVLPARVDSVPPNTSITTEAGSNNEISPEKQKQLEKKADEGHKRHSRDSDDKKKHKKEREKRRHESDYARDHRKKHKKDRERRHDSD
uniref:Multiple myeloma tumor-associated protein 2-like N-terminal domain-containing protein n=2 Tax=Kalanchoe fedtschenkoi TaxID=63787 RepID=A0A7N0TMN3_KALFE